MTECEAVRRLGAEADTLARCHRWRLAFGAPDRMELASATGDQRLLTLTYGRGEHPRLYRFATGRLYAIEALPPPATSARRVR
jgi:hypothetical protein